MSWLVTGAGGILARDVLACLGDEGMGLTRRDLDVTDREAVLAALRGLRPSVVVNCAAWTAVDDAESREPDALAVNGTAVGHLAEACALVGCALVHVSTDYVFDGHARVPYAEGALPGPRTAYGRTKLAGERAVLEALPERGYVVRTAWLYGSGGANFVTTMIRSGASRGVVHVVDDQRGQPTWSADVARRMVRLVDAPPGIYHATNSGDGTWYDLARETFRLLGADPARVHPTTSASYPRPAPRPAYSVLGHTRWREADLPPLRDWREALAEGFPALRAAAGG
ncbi:dTDP-4-dehydrorhamnose reductase [Streptomyces sp. CB03238]|uniref:dTDP-4-dehydrorhamnose reductase n=1 Tax=Streptomyces sp. CB03238 TaxID=1907777 RepID=UPI000A102275|nr:dTDP-4-dehydrorhamnose reductase [Streptomyces sp. CB03238]ORT53728.1 dTDP-4-dehydrorhamnose reductase [Streptomyces sp. CB03238]